MKTSSLIQNGQMSRKTITNICPVHLPIINNFLFLSVIKLFTKFIKILKIYWSGITETCSIYLLISDQRRHSVLKTVKQQFDKVFKYIPHKTSLKYLILVMVYEVIGDYNMKLVWFLHSVITFQFVFSNTLIATSIIKHWHLFFL